MYPKPPVSNLECSISISILLSTLYMNNPCIVLVPLWLHFLQVWDESVSIARLTISLVILWIMSLAILLSWCSILLWHLLLFLVPTRNTILWWYGSSLYHRIQFYRLPTLQKWQCARCPCQSRLHYDTLSFHEYFVVALLSGWPREIPHGNLDLVRALSFPDRLLKTKRIDPRTSNGLCLPG